MAMGSSGASNRGTKMVASLRRGAGELGRRLPGHPAPHLHREQYLWIWRGRHRGPGRSAYHARVGHHHGRALVAGLEKPWRMRSMARGGRGRCPWSLWPSSNVAIYLTPPDSTVPLVGVLALAAYMRRQLPPSHAAGVMSFEVVIVNFHSAPLIGRTVAPRARVRWPDGRREIILVDNSPGDGAADVVWAAAPDATVITNPLNLGYAAGVNLAMADGRGGDRSAAEPGCRSGSSGGMPTGRHERVRRSAGGGCRHAVA